MIKPSVNASELLTVSGFHVHELCRAARAAADEQGEIKKTRGVSIHGSCRPQRPPSIQVRWYFRTLNTRAERITKVYSIEIDVGFPGHGEINGIGVTIRGEAF